MSTDVKAKPLGSAVVPKAEPQDAKIKVPVLQYVTSQYITTIKLFVESTGGEVGGSDKDTTVELRGRITATPMNGESEEKTIKWYLKQNTPYKENKGLGKLLGQLEVTTTFVPPRFTGVLYEEGRRKEGDKGFAPDRYFTNFTVDWSNAKLEWADGRAWYTTQTINSGEDKDKGFVGHLWWQVVKK